MVNKLGASALILFVLLTSQSVPGQTSAPPAGKPTAPGLIKLTGDDEKRAKQLDEQIDKARKADRWDEAIARAEDLVALRTRAQGPKHFETVSADWRLKALRRMAAISKEACVADRTADTIMTQAEALHDQGKYGQAEPMFKNGLEIRRRLFEDDHPDTASSYIWLAANFNAQGKYALAQPPYEKAARDSPSAAHR